MVDPETKSMKLKGYMILKQNYVITVLHEFSGEFILHRHLKNFAFTDEREAKFLFQKDLDRNLEIKVKEIQEKEDSLQNFLSKSHTNFKDYVQNLNLPQHIQTKYFSFAEKKEVPDLMYVYNPELKGAKIMTREEFEINDIQMSEYLTS
ncbi:hypothetical protein SteCoe_24867 [Stentor coeruleus]|uniref:Uncharacterized protein n=1 Tax=Stentor coeruleus TaxID=5963 RepID=A0A1R2BGL5_9CILI|nr:hypothetical protein SteCoe_24867 [Stentor coeruleus]